MFGTMGGTGGGSGGGSSYASNVMVADGMSTDIIQPKYSGNSQLLSTSGITTITANGIYFEAANAVRNVRQVSGNLTAASGSMSLDFTPTASTTGTVYLFGSTVDASNGTYIIHDGTNLIFRKRIAGVNYDATKALALVTGRTYNLEFSWGSAGTRLKINGSSSVKNANTAALQLATTVQVGADGSNAGQPTAYLKNLFINSTNFDDFKSLSRQPFSAGNKTPYTVTNTTNRFHNVRKRDVVANNANWSKPQTEFANWADNQTTHSSYTNAIIEGAIKHSNGTFYRGKYSGANSAVVLANESLRSDDIDCPALTKGSGFIKSFRLVLPLLYKTKTVSFTVGEVVTGGTSGATGTIAAIEVVSGTAGKLTLTGETGVFVNNEALTGNTGGAALVDYTTTQSILCTVTSQPFNKEGIKAGNDPSVNWVVTEPCNQATFTPNLTAGVITSVTRTFAGSGITSSPTFWAYEYMPDGTLQYKNIGYGFLSAGTVTGIGGLSGAAPTGYTWTNPTIVLGGGTDFGGASTLIPDFALVDAIPDVPVYSWNLISDSIGRGNSSTDSTGTLDGLYGIYERGNNLKCGIINMSASGGALGNQVQYATTFAKMYGLYMGKTTHTTIALGTNDTVGGSTEAGIEANMNTLANYVRTFGSKVNFGLLLQRGNNSSGLAITSISRAAQAVIAVANSQNVGDTVFISAIALGMTEFNNIICKIVARDANTITVDVDSSAFTAARLYFSSQTANFTVGQIVTGATSGATATISAQSDSGTTGNLTLTGQTGVFRIGETITDPLGGSAAVASMGSLVPLAPAASQTTATGFGAGGVAANINAKILNGTIVSDWTPLDARKILESPTVYNAWVHRVDPPVTVRDAFSLDLIHPQGPGIPRIANDPAWQSQFNIFA